MSTISLRSRRLSARQYTARLLALTGLTVVAAVTGGAGSAFGATASTQYDAFPVESPDPGVTSRFAERLSEAADLTGDGVRDVFASTWVQNVPISELVSGGQVPDNHAGRLSLINGRTGKVVYKTTPEPQGPGVNEAGPPPTGQGERAGGTFGFYISVVGDVNGDGKEDVVSGAPTYDVPTAGVAQSKCTEPEPNGCNENQGRAYVLNGATGTVIRKLDNPNPQPQGQFGARLGAAGDVGSENKGPRDGVPDILAAATANDVTPGCGIDPATGKAFPPAQFPAGCRANEGEVFVIDGKTGGLIRTLNMPDPRSPTCGSLDAAAPDTTGANCGSYGGGPQGVGDLTGDGIPDFQIPASTYRPNVPGGTTPDSTRQGRIYAIDGATGAVLSRIDQPAADNNANFGLQDLDRGGPGDLNVDGVPELYGTGFLQDGPNGEPSAGRPWVFDGKKSLAAGTGIVLYEPKDPFLGPSRAFGWGESKTDYNKDGRLDLYISNLQSQNTTTSIFDGRDASLLKTLEMPATDKQPPQAGNNGSSLGWSSRAPGDLNGDGEPDYVAAAPYQDVSGTQDQGRVYFFVSNVPAPPPPPVGGGGGGYPLPPGGGGGGGGGGAGSGSPKPVCANSKGVKITGKTSRGGLIIKGTKKKDRICGTNGGDVITGGAGNDVITGGAGNDSISGGAGNDRISGGAGNDSISGGAGNDRISGGAGNDRISGGTGNDRISGGAGNDRISGGAGNDKLSGGSGNDVISGGSGNDVISGGSGNDSLRGDSGKDKLSGGSGNDRLVGGSGKDKLSGGSGKNKLKQ